MAGAGAMEPAHAMSLRGDTLYHARRRPPAARARRQALSRSPVRAPVRRGHLRLVRVDTLPIRRWTGPVAALLVEPGSSRYLPPPLDAARETRRRSAGEWLLTVIEEAEFPGRQWRKVLQVWWIRSA